MKDRLELQIDDIRDRMVKVLDDLEKDDNLQKELIEDTCGFMTKYVTREPFSRDQISEANRLMFAILANDEMVEWLESYKPKGIRFNKEDFAIALASKLKEVDDGTIIAAIISNVTVGNGIPGISNFAYQCVVRETCSSDSVRCTPVARNSKMTIGDHVINPAMMRTINDAMIKHAKNLKKSGQLNDLRRMT